MIQEQLPSSSTSTLQKFLFSLSLLLLSSSSLLVPVLPRMEVAAEDKEGNHLDMLGTDTKKRDTEDKSFASHQASYKCKDTEEDNV